MSEANTISSNFWFKYYHPNITRASPRDSIQNGFRYHPSQWATCTWNFSVVRWIIRTSLFPNEVWHWKGNYRRNNRWSKDAMLKGVAWERFTSSPAFQQPERPFGKWFPMVWWTEKSQALHRIGRNGRRTWYILSYFPIQSFSPPFRHPWLLHLWYWCRTPLGDLLRMLQCLPHINCLRVVVTGTFHICLPRLI